MNCSHRQLAFSQRADLALERASASYWITIPELRDVVPRLFLAMAVASAGKVGTIPGPPTGAKLCEIEANRIGGE
jgi:hypothetical protein